MEGKIYGIFVAGGSGTRMGGDVPKQFILLDGVPVLQRTIRKFVEAVPEMKVVTVLPDAHIATWKDLCLTHAFDIPQLIVKGGITRFHSVRNALKKIPDGAVVMVHDGVRPFVSNDLILNALTLMQEGARALVPVVSMTDTLRYKDGRLPDPDRSEIVAVQTPQIFRSEDLKAAYDQAYSTSFTDDASVLAVYGIPSSQIPGERYNIKLTSPDDLPLANWLVSQGK